MHMNSTVIGMLYKIEPERDQTIKSLMFLVEMYFSIQFRALPKDMLELWLPEDYVSADTGINVIAPISINLGKGWKIAFVQHSDPEVQTWAMRQPQWVGDDLNHRASELERDNIKPAMQMLNTLDTSYRRTRDKPGRRAVMSRSGVSIADTFMRKLSDAKAQSLILRQKIPSQTSSRCIRTTPW